MAVDLGPRLGLLINADIGEQYYDQFRPFLRAIDSLVQASVISISTTPPGSPSNGDAYILGASPTGAWTGHANSVAVWSTEITQIGNNTKVPGWQFFAPNNGWMIWNNATNLLMVFETGVWRNILQDVPLLDANNNWIGFQGFVGGFVVVGGQMQLEGLGAATGSANVNSSQFLTIGSYWNGSSAQPDTWKWQSIMGTGTNPTSTLQLTHNGTPGLASVTIPNILVTGPGSRVFDLPFIFGTDILMNSGSNPNPLASGNVLFWNILGGTDAIHFGRATVGNSTNFFTNGANLFALDDNAAEFHITSSSVTFGGNSVLVAGATPTASATASNLSIPVSIAGTTYYVRLSSTP